VPELDNSGNKVDVFLKLSGTKIIYLSSRQYSAGLFFTIYSSTLLVVKLIRKKTTPIMASIWIYGKVLKIKNRMIQLTIKSKPEIKNIFEIMVCMFE